MNFIDYGYERSNATDVANRIYKHKTFKYIRWITLGLFLGLALLYMALAIAFK